MTKSHHGEKRKKKKSTVDQQRSALILTQPVSCDQSSEVNEFFMGQIHRLVCIGELHILSRHVAVLWTSVSASVDVYSY